MDWLMVKQVTNILLLSLLFWATPALCQDFIVAKVLAVDAEKMELTVVSPAGPDSQIIVRIADESNLSLHDQGTVFPACVAPGETIRLWGSREQEETPHFFATDIRGCKSGGCSDPTGVRSRLRKIREDRQEFSGADSGNSGFGSNQASGRGNGGGQGSGNGGGGGGGGR